MISILMSVYNETQSMLTQSIISIQNQSYKNWELIIVNDNPKDKELANFLLELKDGDSRIKVYTNEYNCGLVKSLNIAIDKANGEYIARMDADDIAKDNRFEEQIAFLEENDLDFVFANVQSIDEYGLTQKEKVLPEKKLLDFNSLKKIMSFTDLAFHPTWFMKRKVIIELNGYRQINSAEDYDFVIRAMRAGFRLGYQGKVLLKYRYRLNSISRNNSLRQEKINSIIQVGLKGDEEWDKWSIKKCNALEISEQEEKKLNGILQSGVVFKKSKKITDGCKLCCRIILYPKGLKTVLRKLMVEKKLQDVFMDKE